MTTTTEAAEQEATTPGDKPAPSRASRFLARLSAARHTNNAAELSAARRWQPGKVDMRMASLLFADDEPATLAEYPVWSQTAKLWVLWHSSKANPPKSSPGEGIGRWAHQLGAADLSAGRLITRIVEAPSAAALDSALTALANAGTSRPPDWFAVMRELTSWTNPARRDSVRMAWARDFYRVSAVKPK